VLVTIEDEVLADQLVYDQVLVGQPRAVRADSVEGAEDLCANLGADLGEYPTLLQSLLEDLLELVDGGHYLNRN
jgi:hypothetical protein